MFKNLPTSTKLLILCGTFMVSIGVPVYGLVTEKKLAIDFAHKELFGSRYLVAVRDIYAAFFPVQATTPHDRLDALHEELLEKLASVDALASGRLQTSELARNFAAALRWHWSNSKGIAKSNAPVLDAVSKGDALAARIGDDSNLALDPDLDTYYLQTIVVRKLPTFLVRLAELQDFFETSVESGETLAVRELRLSTLAGLVHAVASEIKDNLLGAYRGNADGSLKRAIDPKFEALNSSTNSYLGALRASTAGIDARDAVAYNRFHVSTAQDAIGAWSAAQSELERLLQQRIDGLRGKMLLVLALIGVFSGLSIAIALLTHRHIVAPLQRLETVASTVRKTKDYGLRVDCDGQDEIGRVTVAFNDMLAELAAARAREMAERVEFARATRLTTMGEMAASIAHEVNQPLTAIVSNANAGLRWLANPAPDLSKVKAILQRVVRDGHRASDVVVSVRAMIKRDVQEKASLHVNELIEEVLGLLQAEIRSEQIALRVELAAGLPPVFADRVQLQQIVLNLITNAVDAMRASQDSPRLLGIRTEIEASNKVLISVADSGSGIDPKDKDRIFDPFFTTKASGMGLGLSICRSIIEAHGGRLWAAAGSPRGTVFQFTLPSHGSVDNDVGQA